MLEQISEYIRRLTENEDLSIEEATKAFDILFEYDLESYYFFAFTAALHTKGETSDELLAFCKSNEKVIPPIKVKINPEKMIDLSGTGGDRIKTMNVGTAASFIVSSVEDLYVPKQAFYAVTGYTGSGDLLGYFGVDVMEICKAGPKKMVDILESSGIVTYVAQFLGNPEKTKGIFNWVEKRKKIGLNFITPFHLAANVYTPIPMSHRVYGVFDRRYLKTLAELFQKLGYKRGLVYHGDVGLDEISNVGKTTVCEFKGDSIEEYKISPDELGIKECSINDIKAVSKEGNVLDFLKVIYHKDRGPKTDLVCATSGAAFYVMGTVKDLKEGVELSKNLLSEGNPAKQLERYIKIVGDSSKLNTWKKRAGIESK